MGKAPGSDAIPASMYKSGGTALHDYLTHLLQTVFRDTIHSDALEVLVSAPTINEDWCDENDIKLRLLVKVKNTLLGAHENDLS